MESIPLEMQDMVLGNLLDSPSAVQKLRHASPVFFSRWKQSQKLLLTQYLDKRQQLTPQAIVTALKLHRFNTMKGTGKLNHVKNGWYTATYDVLASVGQSIAGLNVAALTVKELLDALSSKQQLFLWLLCAKHEQVVDIALTQPWIRSDKKYAPNGWNVQRWWHKSPDATGTLGWKAVKGQLRGRFFNGFFHVDLFLHLHPNYSYTEDTMRSYWAVKVAGLHGVDVDDDYGPSEQTWDAERGDTIDTLLAATVLKYECDLVLQELDVRRRTRTCYGNPSRDGKLLHRSHRMATTIAKAFADVAEQAFHGMQLHAWEVNRVPQTGLNRYISRGNAEKWASDIAWNEEERRAVFDLSMLGGAWFDAMFPTWNEHLFYPNEPDLEIHSGNRHVTPRWTTTLIEEYDETQRAVERFHEQKLGVQKARAELRLEGRLVGRIARVGTKVLVDTRKMRMAMLEYEWED